MWFRGLKLQSGKILSKKGGDPLMEFGRGRGSSSKGVGGGVK